MSAAKIADLERRLQATETRLAHLVNLVVDPKLAHLVNMIVDAKLERPLTAGDIDLTLKRARVDCVGGGHSDS